MARTIVNLLMGFLSCVLLSCENAHKDDETLYFIGDSLIARWDLQEYFSSSITHNDGVGGAGITYIEENNGTMTERNIVVMIGTNDYSYFYDAYSREKYLQRYFDAILNLNAKKIYLFEILPREHKLDRGDINEYIRQFNSEVRDIVSKYDNIIYIQTYDWFINQDGSINMQYFTDGVHLTYEGYYLLANLLMDKL